MNEPHQAFPIPRFLRLAVVWLRSSLLPRHQVPRSAWNFPASSSLRFLRYSPGPLRGAVGACLGAVLKNDAPLWNKYVVRCAPGGVDMLTPRRLLVGQGQKSQPGDDQPYCDERYGHPPSSLRSLIRLGATHGPCELSFLHENRSEKGISKTAWSSYRSPPTHWGDACSRHSDVNQDVSRRNGSHECVNSRERLRRGPRRNRHPVAAAASRRFSPNGVNDSSTTGCLRKSPGSMSQGDQRPLLRCTTVLRCPQVRTHASRRVRGPSV